MADPDVNPNRRRGRRPYSSPKREERARETRRRIRGAAWALFASDGYTATTMNAIARAAGVGERTVYLAFPTKSELLGEIISVAVRGDDDDAPLATRAVWKQVLDAPGDEILPRFAKTITAILARTAALLAIGEAAAASDALLATRRSQGQRNMRSDYRAVADALACAHALADDVTPAHAADMIYALAGHDVYLRLTNECGWSTVRYTRWLRDTLQATLTRPTPRS